MGHSLPSEPPPEPRAKPLHKAWATPLPRLKLQNKTRERGRRLAAEQTDLSLKRRGTSDVEIAEALVCNRKLIEGWRDANEGIQMGDVYALALVGADRDALAILDDARMYILNLRSARHGG